MPVYTTGADTFALATAGGIGSQANVVGVIKDTSIAFNAVGNVQVNGVLTATTGQWNAITGGGGLTSGSVFYLDPTTPGHITSTVPSTGGQYVVQVGVALSTTELDIQIGPPVLLGTVVGPSGTSGLIGPSGPSGPTGPSGATGPTGAQAPQAWQYVTNGDAGTLAPGTPVYVDSSALMHAANASAAATASVFGILILSTATSVAGPVQFDGAVTLTTTQWNAITGGSTGPDSRQLVFSQHHERTDHGNCAQHHGPAYRAPRHGDQYHGVGPQHPAVHSVVIGIKAGANNNGLSTPASFRP